jgi:hypothetical protein
VLSTSTREGTRLTQLLHDGEALHTENHAACPGSAVVLEASVAWRTDVTRSRCAPTPPATGTPPATARRRLSGGSRLPSMSEEQAARSAAERRKVIENNKAMAAANTGPPGL